MDLNKIGYYILFFILIFISGYSQKNKSYFEEINASKTSCYTEEKVQSLNVSFNETVMLFRYIDERSFVSFFEKNSKEIDWVEIDCNHFYNSSYEDAEKNIKIFRNKSGELYLITPAISEENPILNVYKIANKKIIPFGQYTTIIDKKNDLTKSVENYKLKVFQKKNTVFLEYSKGRTSFVLVKNEDVPLLDKTSGLYSSLIEFESLNLKQKVDFPWRLKCSNELAFIDIDGKLNGYLSLFSNTIYADVYLESLDDESNQYWLKFKSFRPVLGYSEKEKLINDDISKSEPIAKITVKHNQMFLEWFGLFNLKTKKRNMLKIL